MQFPFFWRINHYGSNQGGISNVSYSIFGVSFIHLYFYIYTKNYPKCYLYEMLPIPNVIYTKFYLDEM